jgi:hypothetical protein
MLFEGAIAALRNFLSGGAPRVEPDGHDPTDNAASATTEPPTPHPAADFHALERDLAAAWPEVANTFGALMEAVRNTDIYRTMELGTRLAEGLRSLSAPVGRTVAVADAFKEASDAGTRALHAWHAAALRDTGDELGSTVKVLPSRNGTTHVFDVELEPKKALHADAFGLLSVEARAVVQRTVGGDVSVTVHGPDPGGVG